MTPERQILGAAIGLFDRCEESNISQAVERACYITGNDPIHSAKVMALVARAAINEISFHEKHALLIKTQTLLP